MARSAKAAALTEQHRLAQIQLRAAALRDFTAVWPLWTIGNDRSFAQLVTATVPLVDTYHRLSAALAGAYYRSFRAVEDIPGSATLTLPPPISTPAITTSLYVTGQVEARNALASGASHADARESALVRTSGAVTRHVLAGGRDTIIQSAQADEHARGWARVTDGDPCAFCAMLAGRGPVYKSESTAHFEAHDHCACMAEPFYGGGRAAWPGQAAEYRALYDRVIRDALRSGELTQIAGVNGPRTVAADPAKRTSNDLLNTFRRAYEAGRTTL